MMMTAPEILERLTSQGVVFSLTPNGKMLVDAPKSILTTKDRNALRQHKAAILELIRQKAGFESTGRSDNSNELKNEPPEHCPICHCRLSSDDLPALLVRFCPLGCAFVWRSFNNLEAVHQLVEEMFRAASFDECQEMSDALNERAAIMAVENNWNGVMARHAAEVDLITIWLDSFRLKHR
jgi:hypothetical protein